MIAMNRLGQPFATVNVNCRVNENESHALSAMITRWKGVAVHASDFVWLGMRFVVNDAINSRLFALLSGLKYFALMRAHCSTLFACLVL